MKEITLQTQKTVVTTVCPEMSSKTFGSGDVEVYATPMMVALMEQAAKEALAPFLDEGETSVGIAMSITHAAATPIGMQVEATAKSVAIDRRIITFDVSAQDACGMIGKGTHQRCVVKAASFLERTQQKLSK